MKARLKKELYLFLVQTIIFCFFLINICVHNLLFFDAIKLFLYQFVALFCTGHVIIRLVKIDIRSSCEDIALSYTVGGIISLIIYMLLMLIGLKGLMPYTVLIELCIVVVFKLKNHNEIIEYSSEDKFGKGLCLFLLVVG